MLDKEIIEATSIYGELVEENNERKRVNKRLDQLSATKKVQEFMRILEDAGVRNRYFLDEYSEREMASNAFDHIAYSTESSNGIYVYVGDFWHQPARRGYTSYRRYVDLETTREIRIKTGEATEFESEHKVIIPKVKDKERFYTELREEFFLSLLKNPQEVAVQKILNRK